MRLTVDAASAGLRLDAFVVAQRAASSVAAARRAITEGLVRLDGRAARKGTRLRVGQVVEADEAANRDARPIPAPGMPLAVLYEDEDLVAVNKPAGVPSHPLRAGETVSVAAALVARYPECGSASPDPREGGLAHRLDVGTSGVLLAARHREGWRRLREALGAQDCEKVYVAEVAGAVTLDGTARPFVERGQSPGTVVVTAAIGRSGRRGGRVRLEGGREPLPARTEIAVRARFDGSSLVEARLCKGRAHQVRAHLAYLGCPVVGDTIYGAPDVEGGPPPIPRLHALAVTLRHPMTGRPLRIEAPPPPWAKRGSAH
jgi:23S rRNA pseudouridine1911/1915/1917 synthase